MKDFRAKPTMVGASRCVWSALSNQNWRHIMMAMEGDLKEIPAEWLAEFEAAARRPLALRMKYAFIKTYRPVLDDADYRSFETMAEYRDWCERNLPDWLGYGRV